MPIPECDRDKTAFSCHSSLYRFSRMPFGLTNAPATFQRAMDILLSPFRSKCCLVYLDEIINFSKGFLGLCNVYRRFVPHYAKIAHPLNQLLKKGQPVDLEGFDEPCEKAFHKLKDAILAPPLLALPKKNLPYSVYTDASDYQIGAALFQTGAALFQTHPDAQRKPIRLFSRTLAAAERNYSVSKKECLAVIWAVQTLRPYPYGEHFIVHTDHASLRWLMNVKDPSGRLIPWRLRLSEFDFEIKYKRGKANSQADALSRLRTAGETVHEIDDEIPCFMSERPTVQWRTRKILTRTLCRTAAEFVQVVIPQSLRDGVLGLSHYAKLAGHPGGRELYKTLRRYFYWPTMALDCYAVAKNCAACARERVKLRRNTKEMKLFTPKAPLEFVAIDILGELITTKRGNRYQLHIAQVFVHHWVFVYGPPVKVLSDNGTQFTARFFQNVYRILGIRNVFTTTYHLQANGQVERFNRTLTSALPKYVGEHPKDRELFSDAVTFAYNTQVHRTTNIAPFKLVLARAPRSIALQAQPSLEGFSSNRAYYLKWQSWLESLMKGAGKSLRKEQARYKRNFDARLRKSKYDIPSRSYVFLPKEQGTATDPKHKLAQVATGPYAVKRSDQGTVVIAIGDQEDGVSRDGVELAPCPMDYAPVTGLTQALRFLDGTDGDEGQNVFENGGSLHVHTPPREDPEDLVTELPSADTPQDSRESKNPAEVDEFEDLQKGEGIVTEHEHDCVAV
ncbi:unnamed protein product [Chondrus crispus]|uniref:Integrase catalytic domain-containing protein n=1 Tax=Chondrus crispus TaxID=2769 RepID=R7QJW9_CHOCR|nr:unnamed protein product [Chondrus crispus]CDF38384.1 unnamed protein product [Chondrus crispus]|eukprot:XP_005718277.1 unnamed protein product [Chondrus crispus]